jgi:hypothetical protein
VRPRNKNIACSLAYAKSRPKKNKNGMCIKFALLGDENQVSVLREKRGKGG